MARGVTTIASGKPFNALAAWTSNIKEKPHAPRDFLHAAGRREKNASSGLTLT